MALAVGQPLPRVPLRELVSPVGPDGRIDPAGSYVRPGVSIIYREQGNRMIAVKFSVRDRDLAPDPPHVRPR